LGALTAVAVLDHRPSADELLPSRNTLFGVQSIAQVHDVVQ
jgi:hypothetical protein